MVLVDTYRNPGAFFVEIGSRVPIASTSIGRAYFCGLPQAEQRKLLDELREAHADQWPQLRKAFDQAVLDHQQRGFCVALGEWRREVNGVSVPLVLADETGPVVFSCSGASQMPVDVLIVTSSCDMVNSPPAMIVGRRMRIHRLSTFRES